MSNIVNPSIPIRDFLDALVHPSAREDALTAERHRAFMVPRLFGNLIPLEAALSGLRRAVAVAALFAIGGVGLLLLAGSWFDLAPAAGRWSGAAAALGIVSASLYATGMPVGVPTPVRTADSSALQPGAVMASANHQLPVQKRA